MDCHATGFKFCDQRNSARPGTAIVVATHGGQRRQRSQLLQNFRRADVAGMDDVVGAAQES
jgi:hypothetical protein